MHAGALLTRQHHGAEPHPLIFLQMENNVMLTWKYLAMIFFTKLTNKRMVWNRNETNTAVCYFTETLIPLVLTLLQQAKKDAYRMQPGSGIMFFLLDYSFQPQSLGNVWFQISKVKYTICLCRFTTVLCWLPILWELINNWWKKINEDLYSARVRTGSQF